MKATEAPLVSLLKGPRQFLIPIYQRSYSWTEDQCIQLWEDTLRVAQDEGHPSHFIGSVVYIEHGLYHATTIPQLLVIDGQQRLTTFTLMIEALARVLSRSRATGEMTDRKLRNYFLLNPEESGDLRYKLQLSEADRATLRSIVDSGPVPSQPSRRVLDNFNFLSEQIDNAPIPPERIYQGLAKLMVVDVSLDREHDNPQLIFESLNSTGIDLSQSDLTRNFVLMGLEPGEQERLYNDRWRPMEVVLAGEGREDTFDRFLRAWLTLKMGEVPKLQTGYEVFKRYRSSHPELDIVDLLADLGRCAESYACIALGAERHAELARVFSGLQELRIDAPMPFLLHVYGAWREGFVGDGDLVQIVRLLESWLFRRAVCDIPSNVLSRTFATLPGLLDRDRLLESFALYLATRSERQRFPKDEEFRTALRTRNLYDFKHRQYCLTRLENHERKERVDLGQYSVEHVLPQNEALSAEWRDALGADWKRVREQWLHTLGNLTLTGYNPELSDRPFVEKRAMKGGFADSPLRLNRSLAHLNSWNEATIVERAEQLSNEAVAIWPAPRVAPDAVARRRIGITSDRKPRTVSLDHFRMTSSTSALYRVLVEEAQRIGIVPTIRRNFIAFGVPDEGRPYPLIVWPRKGWLRARLFVPHSELKTPPEFTFSYEPREGDLRTGANLRNASEVRTCIQLLTEIPSLHLPRAGQGHLLA